MRRGLSYARDMLYAPLNTDHNAPTQDDQEPMVKSKREIKRGIKDDLRALRAKPGWDPSRFQREPYEDRLRNAVEHDRLERLWQDAAGCPNCQELRTSTGDAEALCREHLARAMGT